MTGLEWLARNLNNPWVEGVGWLGTGFVLAFFVADFSRTAYVPGSHARYVAASIEVWLGLPAVAAELWSGVCFAAKANGLMFAIDVFFAVYIYRIWRKAGKDDNWWNGRGKKIWKSVKSRLTIQVPNPAPIS